VRFGPGIEDWLLLVVSATFTVGGLAIALGKGDRAGFAAAAFFGGCTLVAIWSIVHKLRVRSNARATSVEVCGGVPLEARRAHKLTTSVGVAIVGAVMAWFGAKIGTVIVVIGAGMALLGVALTVLLALNLLPRVFLQFEPEGLRFGQGSYTFLLEWNNIAMVAPGDLHGNDVVLIHVRDLRRLGATVDGAANGGRRLARLLRWNRKLFEADVALMPMLFGLDMALVAHALKRYISDPSARESLRAPLQIAAIEGSRGSGAEASRDSRR
jgi:hypothetical protein